MNGRVPSPAGAVLVEAAFVATIDAGFGGSWCDGACGFLPFGLCVVRSG
jgi:hypothetical protein